MQRQSGRHVDQRRKMVITHNYTRYAEGSCLIECGYTKVLCTASVENKVPPFLRNKGQGWVTAEYGMLPRSTHERMDREASKGKQSGRTVEIQRLIGRSLRAVINPKLLGERQIKIDCDVIQADGGTRTAAITGAYVAMQDACNKLCQERKLKLNPIVDSVFAISCGLINHTNADGEAVAVLDLDYSEDSKAIADANFVLTGSGKIIEIQTTAEDYAISFEQFNAMQQLAIKGINEIKQVALDCAI